MNTDGRIIFHNTFLLSLTEFLAGLMSFILIMVVARQLGPELMGVYAFGIVFVGFFHIFVNFGLEPYIQREVSRHQKIAGSLMAQVFVLKLIIYLISAIFILIIGLAIADDELKRSVIWILTGAMFFKAQFLATNAFFRAYQKAKYEAWVRLSLRLVYTCAGLTVIFSGRGLLALVSAELVVQAAACCFAWGLFITRIATPFKNVTFIHLKELLKTTWRFFLIRMVQMIFNAIDLVMLSFMAGDVVTGFYAAAVRLTAAFGFLPNAFSGAFLPTLSRTSAENLADFGRVFDPYFRFLLLIGVGLGAIIAGLSENIVVLLYGHDFLPATSTLALMAVALVLTFINWPLSNAIIALDRERHLLRIFSICAGANIIFNLGLIPVLMDKGAAWATIFSQFGLLILQGKAMGAEARKMMNLKHLFCGSLTSGLLTWTFIQMLGAYNFGLPLKLMGAIIIFLFLALITKTLRISDLVQGKKYFALRQ
jgi:O-antigen/teichoic acid export membrane protein